MKFQKILIAGQEGIVGSSVLIHLKKENYKILNCRRKDLDFLSTDHFTDSIFFYPEKGLEKIVMDLETGKKLIQAMH